jgi:hypothetical protein
MGKAGDMRPAFGRGPLGPLFKGKKVNLGSKQIQGFENCPAACPREIGASAFAVVRMQF